jgi:hypothetical protein
VRHCHPAGNVPTFWGHVFYRQHALGPLSLGAQTAEALGRVQDALLSGDGIHSEVKAKTWTLPSENRRRDIV